MSVLKYFVSPSLSFVRFGHLITLCRLTHCQHNKSVHSVLCRMKMLPVMILAKCHSRARSAVSERSNSSARLVSRSPNSSARLVSRSPNSSARLVFERSNLSARLVFERSNLSARRLEAVPIPQSRRAQGAAYCRLTFIAACYGCIAT